MSEVEFKKFATCDTCGVETLCREVGDEDQCGGCYWAPIHKAEHESQLAALQEELAEKQSLAEIFYKRQQIAESKLKTAEQRLADAERRNALPADWKDQLFAEMERRFDLRKHIDDDHMVNDDTQIGVEFAIEWMTAALNPNP